MKKLKFLFLVFLLFFFSANNSIAQDQELVDSLEMALINTEVDTIKVKLLTRLGLEYGKSDPDKKMEYGLKAKKLSEKINFKMGVLQTYKLIARAYDTKGELDKAMEIDHNRMETARQLGNKDEIARVFNSIGENFRKRG